MFSEWHDFEPFFSSYVIMIPNSILDFCIEFWIIAIRMIFVTIFSNIHCLSKVRLKLVSLVSLTTSTGGLQRWYNPVWYSEQIPTTPYDSLVLRKAFEKVGFHYG